MIMRTIDELDLILTLLRKHELPISPILEYAINEKKEALHETPEDRADELPLNIKIIEPESIVIDNANIILTRDLIEAARTPNGGFTKSQLAAVGVAWPPAPDWIEQKEGMLITKSQLEQFNKIQYVAINKVSKKKR